MLLIPGIIASSRAVAAGDYESIATVTIGAGGAASAEFTGIAADWTHLQIRLVARNTASSTTGGYVIQFNSDTTIGNYYNHGLYGSGGGSSAYVFAYALDGNYYAGIGLTAGATAAANIFGSGVIDILDYRNTNKFKTVRNLCGADANGSGQIRISSGFWQSTSAITSIKLVPTSGNSFSEHSKFALYGIKAA